GGLSKTVIQSEFPGGPSPYSPPWENGFDECFSTESMMPTYNPYYQVGGKIGTNDYRYIQKEPVAKGQKTGGHKWPDFYWTGPGQFVDEWLEGDDSKIIMDKAIDFIQRKSIESTPFLSVIWFHTPHTPVVAGNEQRAKYPEQDMQGQHWFGAISALDEQIGRLRRKLRELKIENNTIVWFCSDNGPSYIHNYNSSGGLRGKKAELYEGGIRVPSILEWPQKITKPGVSKLPVSTSDFYPTLLSICGIRLKNQPIMDGKDILDLILSGETERPYPIMFESPVPKRMKKSEITDIEQFAVINNQFKLISIDNGRTFQLYNLEDDFTESNDLSQKNPEIKEEMELELKKWQSSCEESAKGLDYH
ncbi:MAG TPA: sulfatase-like hydrolase/transferase, partial [Draconibacterium sp.]|nr:sulfatase-like hydrolase/transferase [Draconibacterium sp.]